MGVVTYKFLTLSKQASKLKRGNMLPYEPYI